MLVFIGIDAKTITPVGGGVDPPLFGGEDAGLMAAT